MKVKEEKLETDIVEEIEATFSKKNSNPLVGTKIQRGFKAVVKDLGEGMMEAVISSEMLDRHGEQIDMKGMNIKEYMKNPIVADAHNYDLPSVGRTHKLTKKADGTLVARFEWAKDIYDKAKLLYSLYRDGFQYAFSIGFMVDEMDGNTFTKSTMLEFSPVLIPANPEALLLAKQKGLDKVISPKYNGISMKYSLKEILEKELNDLTVGEIAFLKANSEDLTKKQLTKYASVLDEPKKEIKDEPKKEVKDEPKDEDKDEDKKDDEVKAIGKSVAKMQDQIDKLLEDPVKVKNIKISEKSFNLNKNTEVSKEKKFYLYVKGIQTGNMSEYVDAVGKDAMNTTDDGILLPPAEFLAEVERLEEQYGVARKFATVRQSSVGNGITYLMGDDDLEIYDTAEGGVKKSTKLSYKQLTLQWRKFAGILPITDELNEDSAINLFADAANRFARAYAKKEDELVFTEDDATGVNNLGILYEAGTNVVNMSGTGSDDSFEDVSYTDLVDLYTSVPTSSQVNGRFYFHRTMLGSLMKMLDDNGKPLWLPAVSGGAPATILNKPYELVEVMPSVADSAQDAPFVIFGDLRYVTLGERTGLNIVIRDTGIVGDPDEVDQSANTLNLFTQDMQAMRAVKRFNSVVRFPAAFSVLKTGNYNS